MSDIKERLRGGAETISKTGMHPQLQAAIAESFNEAADYIEQLEKKAARYEWLRKYNFNNRWTDEEIDREIERDKIIADTALSHTK